MFDVRDLLIRMSLDASNYKTNIADAKRELATLKAEHKALASDGSLEQSAAQILKNLQDQKTAAEALVTEYQKGIDAIEEKLRTVESGSQSERALVAQSQTLEKNLANAQTSLNGINEAIKNMKMDALITQAETVANWIMTARMGFGQLLNGAGEFADDSYDVFVSREAALVEATKNIKDEVMNEAEINAAVNEMLTRMTTTMPRTYENLAELLGTGATLGVPYENLEKFTEVMGKLETATNISGERGAQGLAHFVNLTEKSYENLDRVGSTITALGNASATTEADILEMAHRAASGLTVIGMKSQDILGISAALASVGIEAAAGGTSISKLGVSMDKAANLGAAAIEPLISLVSRLDHKSYESLSDVSAAMKNMDEDTLSIVHEFMASTMGIEGEDILLLSTYADAAEKFAEAMGMTVQEFGQSWKDDAAATMMHFFQSLGELEGTSVGDNLLWVMTQLGISEIRQSNMVRALANNYQLLGNSLDIAREAYEENVALDQEAQRFYETTESKQAINRNKSENALAATGETMDWRQPFEDFFGNLEQWYKDWPVWARTAVGAVSEIMGGAGDVLTTAGELSFSLLNITRLVRDIKGSSAFTGLGGKLGMAAGAIGTAALGVGVFGATYGLLEYINDVGLKTDDISEKLQGLKITVDPNSKDETLAAIAEVQAAADKLRGGEENADYANTSKVVQMGYGTMSMYGTALAYEQARAEAEIEGIYSQYGGMIRQAESALLEAQDETAREAAQHQIDALEQEMNAKVGEARSRYSETLSAVINGAVQQTTDPSNLEKIAKQYNALDVLLNALTVGGGNIGGSADPEAFSRLAEAFVGTGLENTWNTLVFQQSKRLAGNQWMDGKFAGQMVNGLYNAMAEAMPEVFGNGQLMAILTAALQSGAMDSADASGFTGALMGLLAAMDIKQIGDQNTSDWRDIGKNSMAGLGEGITENQSTATGAANSAAQGLIDAAKSVLQIHSPSQVFEAIGENVSAGLAQGIYAGADEALAAASWLASQIEATMRSALDIHSPSGVARTLGGYIGAGLAEGISGSLGRLEKVSGGLAASVGGVAGRAVNVTLNIDGQKMAQVLTPMVDQVISEANWTQ